MGMQTMGEQDKVKEFINRWKQSGAAERANYQLFLTELAELLDVPRPEPAKDDDRENAYVFDRAIKVEHSGSTNFIDLYKRNCFVLEAKQGADADNPEVLSAEEKAAQKRRKNGTSTRGFKAWDAAIIRARNTAPSFVQP